MPYFFHLSLPFDPVNNESDNSYSYKDIYHCDICFVLFGWVTECMSGLGFKSP